MTPTPFPRAATSSKRGRKTCSWAEPSCHGMEGRLLLIPTLMTHVSRVSLSILGGTFSLEKNWV